MWQSGDCDICANISTELLYRRISQKCSISASFFCKLVHIEAFGENGKRMGMIAKSPETRMNTGFLKSQNDVLQRFWQHLKRLHRITKKSYLIWKSGSSFVVRLFVYLSFWQRIIALNASRGLQSTPAEIRFSECLLWLRARGKQRVESGCQRLRHPLPGL